MKLCYRGVRYQREPLSLETQDSEILAQYRGQSYAVRYPRHMTVAQPSADFTYRGAPYRTTAVGNAVTRERRPRGTSRPTLVPNEVPADLARVHQDNLCKKLSARMAAARDRGDVRLLQLLEREGEQLVCSR